MSAAAAIKFNFEAARVAILDANKFSLRVSRTILAGFGFRQIVGFETPEEAGEKLQITAADLFLCDPFPAVEQTFALLRALRSPGYGETSMSPIIVTTARVGIDILKSAKECRVDFVVAKPFSPQVLLDRVIWSAKQPGRRNVLSQSNALISSTGKTEVELW